MTQTSGDADFLHKRASFIQHSLPGLDAGRYQISVQQSLKTSAGADISGTGLPSVTRTFGVAAPRFSLSQDAIHSVFPQPNGAGEFSGSLAHVVLETEKLPWQRTPYAPGNQPSAQTRMYSTVVNGETVPVRYDDDSASWLGVLLVSPSDFGGQDPSRLIVQGTVDDLIPGTLGGTLPANAYSVFSYLLEPEYAGKTKPPIDPGVGILATDAVRYLDVPCTLFNAIAPSIADLEMSAHVRAVEMDAKPIAADATVDARQQYAVVIGNRLPESLPQGGGGNSLPPPGTNVAMLVSYEALQFALRGHQAGSYYDTSVASLSNGVVRLAVLYQWRFTSWQDTSFEFEMLLKALNGRNSAAGNAAVDVPNPMLRLPSPPVFSGETDSQTIVQDMLSSGYLPYQHLTRVTPEADPTGTAQTVSWYRGPLIPFGAFVPAIAFLSTADPVTGEPLIFSADQLLRFDPNVGMYDVSYAAAWQLGQLLALYNKDFSVALYRWKQQAAMALRGRRERSGLDDFYQDRSSVLQHLVRSGRLTR
jgi:hypothetical protein